MNNVAKVGYWSALISFIAAAGYSIVQILQVVGVLAFPFDEILIFGFSICIATPFALAMVALHHSLPEKKRIWTHCAIIFGIIYATIATIVYATEPTVIIPARLNNSLLDSMQMFTMIPHTFMWIIDGVGYISMGLSTLFAAGAFWNDESQKWLKWFLVANGLLDPLIIAIYIFPNLLLFGSIWIITAPGSLLLLMAFFREKYSS